MGREQQGEVRQRRLQPADEMTECRGRLALLVAEQIATAALLHQAGVKGIQRGPQKALPVGATAGKAPGRQGIVGRGMHIHRQHPLRLPGDVAEGGVVGEAQVVAEPVDQGGHGAGMVRVMGGGAAIR